MIFSINIVNGTNFSKSTRCGCFWTKRGICCGESFLPPRVLYTICIITKVARLAGRILAETYWKTLFWLNCCERKTLFRLKKKVEQVEYGVSRTGPFSPTCVTCSILHLCVFCCRVIVWFEKTTCSDFSFIQWRREEGEGKQSEALSGAEPKTCPKIGTQVS